MTISLYELASGTFAPMLRTLSNLLDKGAAHARAHDIAEGDLLDSRLAPDMYPLTRQVQLACSNALEGVASVTGREQPTFTDDERTIDDLKRLLAKTVAALDGLDAKQFDGAAERRIDMPIPDDLTISMSGAQWLRDWAIPHFYFHVVTAYDILRHRGVEIGKRDYLARVGVYIKPR